ncbi:MAG: hypothetical protein PHV78_03250 [Patescibacteria group bacterium]|nr:hypothetical protein [Patescibacteria group bacterium]MDD5121597.1 hypothetical protein [Patescibacteria group bacterium]MDD5222155.1 hypothetical protein [Patescibacteria group bacterium]MDD5396239.1 hypothetical protein [Patescibacteria group bacterium]
MADLNQDLNIKEVKFAKWYETRKGLFKKIPVLVLVLVCIIVWAVGINQTVKYFINTSAYQQTIFGLVKNWVDYVTYNESKKPALPDVNVAPLISYLGPDNLYHYHLLAKVKNNDSNWIISSLSGEFKLGDTVISVSNFFLPNEQKYLMALNQTNRQLFSTADFTVTGVSWRRARPDIKSNLSIINNLSYQDVNFIPGEVVGDKITPARVQFIAANHSAYSFWQTMAQLLIYQGNKIVDAYLVPINDWMTGQEKFVEINLIQQFPSVTRIEIIPNIDLLNKNIFIKP